MQTHLVLNPGLNETNKQILSHLSRGLTFGESTGLTKGLTPGKVVKGYEYLGGDPSDKESWKKKD
jgi:hypothetical protein